MPAYVPYVFWAVVIGAVLASLVLTLWAGRRRWKGR